MITVGEEGRFLPQSSHWPWLWPWPWPWSWPWLWLCLKKWHQLDVMIHMRVQVPLTSCVQTKDSVLSRSAVCVPQDSLERVPKTSQRTQDMVPSQPTLQHKPFMHDAPRCPRYLRFSVGSAHDCFLRCCWNPFTLCSRLLSEILLECVHVMQMMEPIGLARVDRCAAHIVIDITVVLCQM